LNKKILIAYASGFGTTKEIAEDMGKELRNDGFDVDVQSVTNIKDISNYDGVIIGASIRAGALLSTAVKFADQFWQDLRKVPVALFVVALTMQADTPENRRIVSCWIEPVRDIIEPFNVGLFAGQLVLKELPFAEPLLKQLISQPDCDCRDWDKIHAWTSELVPVLRGNVPPTVAPRPEC
jgi:menaquinone-dependent protoporphyrinogen oxidase